MEKELTGFEPDNRLIPDNPERLRVISLFNNSLFSQLINLSIYPERDSNLEPTQPTVLEYCCDK